MHALVIKCECVCMRGCVRIFLPIDLTNTLEFFNNKEKGDRTRDQKIIIHIPSHLKNTHCTHMCVHIRIFTKFYNYICTRVWFTHILIIMS